MASDFLRKLAEEQAEGIQETFGKGAYGSTAYIPRRVEEEDRNVSASHQAERRGVTTPNTERTRRETTPSRFLQEQAAQAAEQEATRPRLMLPTVDTASASRMAERRGGSAPNTERMKTERRTYGVDTSRVSQRPPVVSGNIDLNNRPIFHNADGSISTVDSISFGIDNGREVLLPTIGWDDNGNAVRWTDEEAWQHYLDTGEHLGIFNSVDDANNYAKDLHKSQESRYVGNRSISEIYSDADTMSRWQELASKDKLTADEKKEARAARQEIDRAMRGTIRGTGWFPNMTAEDIQQRNELGNLKNALEVRSSVGSAFLGGVLSALGLDWLVDKVRDLGGEELKELTGNAPTMKELKSAAQAAAPGAFTVGNIAGNLAEMIPLSGAVGSALKGVEWFGKAAPWLQRAITSGITFGITGAQGALTEDKDLGGIALGAATGALSGAAGGALESFVGLGTSNALRRYGLQFNPIFRALAGGLSGAGFAAGSTTVQELSRYLQYPEGYTASPQQIGTDLAIAFLFSTVSSALAEAKSAPQNRESILRMMDDLARYYGAAEMEMAGMTGEARRQAAQRVAEMTSRIRSSVATSRGMSGVSNEVKQLMAALDIIDDRMAAIIAGGNGLLGAADVMQAAQQMGALPLALPSWSGTGPQGTNLEQAVQIIGANAPAPQGQAPATPAWYNAYQGSPRPIDQPAPYVPTIPTPPVAQEAAPSPSPVAQETVNAPEQAETAPPVETPQRGAEGPTEGTELRGPDFSAWDGIYNQDRVSNLTPEEQRVVEQMPTANETRTGGGTLTQGSPEGIVEEPAPVYSTDAGNELASGLRSYDRLEKNGFEYTVSETSAGWIGRLHDIRGNKFSGMISDARALDYQTQALGSREEAIDTLVQVAERNHLLEKNPGPHVRMSPEEEARIMAEEAARNAAEERAPGSGLKLPTNEAEDTPIHVGAVTTIKHPYTGEVPVQKSRSRDNTIVPEESVARAENFITSAQTTAKESGKGFKNALTKLYEQVFKKKTGVPVEGMTFKGAQYLVDIGNQVPGKVINDKNLKAEKLALLDILPEVVQNAQYVGSGVYEPQGKKTKPVVRYDYFESPVEIGGKPYVAKFDVEVLPGANNYRTHQIINVDLSDPGARLAGPAPVPSSGGTDPLAGSITEPGKKVKTHGLTLPTAEQAPAEEAPAQEPKKITLPKNKKPHEVLADSLIAELEEGNTITSKRLQEMAEKAFGGTRGSGAYDIKTAYDTLELAVNKYLMGADFVQNANGDAAVASKTEGALQQFMGLLPTQTVRTEEQQQFQQFSTPPNIAYLAAWAANISGADTVLEPSAGIGGLALWPKAWGATVYGNELSERRAEILRSLGLDEVFTENAEQINNVLPDYVKPSVVLMNPPFSATAGRLSSNNTANAKRHIEQALDRMEDGGRLVAILGRGMSNDSKTFSPWWNDLRKEYDIKANLSINGENYKKYGTTFDVQLVVIDKTGPQAGETITGNYDDLTEIPSVLEGIRNDRTQPEENVTNIGGRSVRAHAGPERNGPVSARPAGNDQRPAGSASGTDRSGAPRLPGNGGRAQSSGAGENGLRIGDDSERNGVGGESSSSSGSLHPESGSKRGSGSESELSVPLTTEKPAKSAKPTGASSQKAGNDDGVYAEYVPPKTLVKGAKKHPAQIVESAAMAAVDAPQATYVPNLPEELITSGALSDVQLTNIVYAGQAHSQMIPNQNIRRGYFIGDGTGVGKGRQIAGIILDNFRQGRTKAVWVSQRQNLLSDAKRDWKAMGMSDKDILSTAKIKGDDAIEAPTGILFSTYKTLASKSKAGKSRLDQIVNWLGPDFDGVIALDEAHTMGNLLGKKGKRGNSKPAEYAIAGAELQKRLPNARIVYASATIATDVNEMAFAERLGLWGPGTQFSNVRDFVEKISSGGMAAMELVARDMKAMGLYQARSISYNGVQYDTIQHDLTPMQKEIYDTMSRAWQVTLKHMNEALEMTGASLNGNAKTAAKSAYYGAMQRFYNQILTSMAMPSVIEDIKKELAAGRSCVLQIVNTNEAETNRQLAKVQETGGDLEDLDITPRENLVGFFRNSFPVQVYEEYEDDNGNKRSRPVTDSKGNPVLDKKAVALRDRMIAEIEAMSVPEGPMEMLFDAFGVDQVAEVTGRKRRIVPGKDEYGNTVRVEEKRGSGSGEADAQAFQDGKKHILVFSDAGGTGKSYHADRTAKNQEQRVHYLIQAGWSAPKAVQGFGRTNRSNQASAPIYKLVTTDVKGQKRFISTIARRLDQLGALTKGQRQTGSGVFSARDNLESDLATDTLYNFYQALVRGQIEGLDAVSVLDKLGLMDKFTDKESGRIKVPDGDGRDMSLFLNRILALEYDEQNMVFDAFNRMLDDAYETALANGTLDMGMETVRADKIDIVDDMTVREDPETGVATNYVQAKLSEKARIVKTVDDLKALRGDFVGLYKKKNGETVGVFRTKDKTETNGNVVKQYILQSPLERKFSRYVESTLKKECERIPEKEWNTAWKAEVEKTPEYTETIKHMLTGSLLPIWNKLPQSGNVRVQRLIADDGRQYLGRIIDPSQIDSVLKSLGVSKGRTKQTYTADDVIKRVLKDGDRATLENNRIALTRRRVGGEMRIEITGDNLWYLMRTNPDIISETINYRPRYFLPTGEKQKQALENLLKENPVQDITQMRGGDDEVSNMVDSARNFTGNNAPRHPENWTAERVGDKSKKPMSLPDIVNMIRHDFDIPVSTGNIRSPQARAQYHQQPQSVRSKITNAIPDIAHELGHHLDNLYDIEHGISKAARDEIVNAMPADFKAKYKDREIVGEGIAEFLRRYLQNSETAQMDYPIFSEEFFAKLSAKDRAAIDKLADEVNAYYSLSQDTGNWPVHNREDRGRDYRDVGEKLKDLNTHFRTLFVDSMEPIKRIDEATGGKVHLFAINSAYAGNRAYAAITGDLYDLRGNPLGDGLQKVLKDIHLNNRREYSDFGMYLVCRHGPERLAEGMRVFADDAWDNTAWMEARAEELAEKYPQFEEAADRLEEFQKRVLQAYGVDSGLYSQETVDAWYDRWEHYVPLNRWFGDKAGSAKGQKRGFANQTGPYRKAVGSGRDIINPVDNILENTVRLITTSIYNDVMQKITREVAGTEGLGWLMEQIPMPLARKTWDGKGLKSKTLDAFDAYFTDAGKSLDEKQLDLIQTILDGAIDDLLVQYGRGKAHGDVVTVMKGGKPQYWKVNDPDLLRSITNMGPSRSPSFLNYLGRINRFITGNITGMNVVWSVASNMPRDLGTMFTFSKTKNLVKLLAGIGESYVNAFRGDNASEVFKEFMAMGGISTGAQTSDKDMTKKARKALQKHISDYLNPLEWVEFVSDMIERGPRYSYYKICRTKYGMTPDEAFYAAMEITTNFKRAGILGREINMIIPFFNASVQGVDRAARWLAADEAPQQDKKKVRAGRITAFVGASLAIAALSMALNLSTKKKRENLEKLSNFTKNTYFVIPMKNGKYLAIPKPRELAILISLFERIMETYIGQNPHAMDDFWEYATDNILPGVVSGVVQGDLNSAIGDLGVVGTLHYLTSNQDFLGRPIVSSALQKVEPRDQYNGSTSKLAKLIGQAFGLSPQQIDFVGNDILGGFWSWQKALAPVSGQGDLSLGVRNKWVKDPLYSTDIVNRLYDEMDRLERVKNSHPGDVNAAIEYRTARDTATFYGQYYRLARNEEDLGEDAKSREVRTAVLDMLLGVERGEKADEGAYRFMVEALNHTGNAELMPAVQEVTVKADSGKVYNLTSEEYFDLQTRYLSLYYNYVRRAMDRKPGMSLDEKVSTLEAAKQISGIVARGEAITAHGGESKEYQKVLDLLEDSETDVDEGEFIGYLAAKDLYGADGSVTNTDLLGAAAGLRLPSINEQAALVGYSNASLGLKLRAVGEYEVDASDYQRVLLALGTSSLSQENASAAIDEVYGPTTNANRAEKAAMWQALNKGWKASNNPYDAGVSETVKNRLTLPVE